MHFKADGKSSLPPFKWVVMCTTQSVGMQVYNGFMLNENINQWKWNYQLLKSADKYSLTVVCWTGRIYEKKKKRSSIMFWYW